MRRTGYLRLSNADGDSGERIIAIGPAGSWPSWWTGVAHNLPGVEFFACVPPGRAHRISETPPRSIQALAEDLASWLRPLLLEDESHRTLVIGVCSGALIASQAMAEFSTQVARSRVRLVLANPTPLGKVEPGMVSSANSQFTSDLIDAGHIPDQIANSPDLLRYYRPAIEADMHAVATYDREIPVPSLELSTCIALTADFAAQHAHDPWLPVGSPMSVAKLSGEHRSLVLRPGPTLLPLLLQQTGSPEAACH